jgi:hypothetical protein
MFSVFLVETGFLFLPISAAASFFFVRRKWPNAQKATATSIVAVILATIAVAYFGIRFTSGVANIGWLLVCYAGYCFLVGSATIIKIKAVRIAVLLVAAFPIGVGYYLALTGLLGVGIMIVEGDQLVQTQQLTDNLRCNITIWSFPGTDHSETRLFRSWTYAPFVWKEIAHRNADYISGENDVSCETLLVDYNGRPR